MTRSVDAAAGAIFVFLIMFIGFSAHAADDARAVFVNGARLQEDTIRALERSYRVRLQSGRFWYDRLSGLWGLEGGPTVGQIWPGLSLGGPLRANASNGTTGVFINRREIHELELRYLQSRFGQVTRGRYWLNGEGIGGFEGGPPQFNISLGSQRIGNDWIRRTPGGTVGGSGGCFYYSHPNGSSVMTGNC
jgi:hypothetical protein